MGPPRVAVATDGFVALTVGRGGESVAARGGLLYGAGGRSPKFGLLSRTGVLCCAKAVDQSNCTTSSQAAVRTASAVVARQETSHLVEGGSLLDGRLSGEAEPGRVGGRTAP